MGVVFEPDSLWNLALGALGQYICSVSENPTVDTCQRLKVQLRQNIPPALANEVTSQLLRVVNEKLICSRGEYEDLVTALILPSVTILDFVRDSRHSRELHYSSWQETILRAVWRRLDTLNNLKVLRLNGVFHEMNSLRLPSSLVEFTYSWCGYEELEQLSACCRRLTKLDVSYSEYIDGACIELILTFEHLEDVNIQSTNVGKNDLTR